MVQQIVECSPFCSGKFGDHCNSPKAVDMLLMPPICKWILSVLNKTIGQTVIFLEAYNLSDATSAIYFWWHYQLCHVFIGAIKPYFNDSQEFESSRAACKDTLWICLDTGLRLLHPFMPYITEELWQRLPHPQNCSRKDSIMITEYPSIVEEWADPKLENEMDIIFDAVNRMRSLMLPEINERLLRSFGTDVKEDLFVLMSCSLSLLKHDDPGVVGCAIDAGRKLLSAALEEMSPEINEWDNRMWTLMNQLKEVLCDLLHQAKVPDSLQLSLYKSFTRQ